jgi:hypothetical protein
LVERAYLGLPAGQPPGAMGMNYGMLAVIPAQNGFKKPE